MRLLGHRSTTSVVRLPDIGSSSLVLLLLAIWPERVCTRLLFNLNIKLFGLLLLLPLPHPPPGCVCFKYGLLPMLQPLLLLLQMMMMRLVIHSPVSVNLGVGSSTPRLLRRLPVATGLVLRSFGPRASVLISCSQSPRCVQNSSSKRNR